MFLFEIVCGVQNMVLIEIAIGSERQAIEAPEQLCFAAQERARFLRSSAARPSPAIYSYVRRGIAFPNCSVRTAPTVSFASHYLTRQICFSEMYNLTVGLLSLMRLDYSDFLDDTTGDSASDRFITEGLAKICNVFQVES